MGAAPRVRFPCVCVWGGVSGLGRSGRKTSAQCQPRLFGGAPSPCPAAPQGSLRAVCAGAWAGGALWLRLPEARPGSVPWQGSCFRTGAGPRGCAVGPRGSGWGRPLPCAAVLAAPPLHSRNEINIDTDGMLFNLS